ncbi:C3a anaphylatoxin chemotactic receptor [Sorex fumeus]|uniref:C3a anaphylatoxin chemotactic receptor n=1 Tax=Sorex fumeus TaxID=62283 RepID=UPI0024ACB52F|nr:C3a anaphylatoxin chemotactic receptor [Sorex fumeus]
MESLSAESNATDTQPLAQPPLVLSMVILSLTFLLGFPGNGLVLWITGLKMRRTVNTVWFLHLTLADFLCCLSLPFSLAHLALREHWPYGWLLCKIIPSVIVLNMFASVFLLTAISLDRCLLVLKPVWCQNHRKVRTALATCACVWASAFIMCIPVFVYRETFVVGNRSVCNYNYGVFGSLDYPDYHSFQFDATVPAAMPSAFPTDPPRTPLNNSDALLLPDSRPLALDVERFSYSTELPQYWQYDYMGHSVFGHHVATPLVAITLTRLVLGFLLPAGIMVVCYSLLVLRLRQGRFHKSRGKTLRVSVAVVVVFLACWAPYHVVGVLSLFTDPETPSGEALLFWDHVSIALATANSCFNPFLYALLGKDFRRQARQSMQGILEAAFSEEPTHTTSCAPNKGVSEGNSASTAV